MPARTLIRKLVIATGVTAALLSAAAPAGAASLGIADDFNVFVLGDLTKSNVDAQGRVAVGGNATLNNYTTGSSLGNSGTNLIVNGNLTNTGGGTQHGTVLVNGNATLSTPTITGKLQVNGNTYINPSGGGSVAGGIVHNGTLTTPSYFAYNTPMSTGYTALPFSFADAATYLTTHSTFWGSLAANGTAASPYNNLSLTGTDTAVNVFNVSASMLGSANGLNISAPAGSTVLVNVFGDSVTVPSMGITLAGGLDKQRVLFNFPTATSVNFNSIGVLGSVLAPVATVNFHYGNIDGTLVARHLTGTGEEHHYRFLGSLPDLPTAGAVPTPSAGAAGTAALSLLALRRHRRPVA